MFNIFVKQTFSLHYNRLGTILTVDGSSSDSSSSARRKNTLPRLIRHNIRSKPGTRSRGTTPATNLM